MQTHSSVYTYVCACMLGCVCMDEVYMCNGLSTSGDRLLVEHQICDQKVASLNPGRSGRRIFFSRVNFLRWLLLSVCSTPMLLQWHLKDPGHSAKNTGGRLHLNTHTPSTQQSWSELTMPLRRHRVGNLSGNEITRYSSGNVWPQSSQLTEPLWTDPSLRRGNSVCDLISTLEKKKKSKSTGREWIVEHSPQILTCKEKATSACV